MPCESSIEGEYVFYFVLFNILRVAPLLMFEHICHHDLEFLPKHGSVRFQQMNVNANVNSRHNDRPQFLNRPYHLVFVKLDFNMSILVHQINLRPLSCMKIFLGYRYLLLQLINEGFFELLQYFLYVMTVEFI